MTLATTILTSPWLRPLNDLDAVDDLLAMIHPTWALRRIKARVLAEIAEAPDVKTFVLRANRNWPGFRAGQHVGVAVEIAGVRHLRRYSIASAPGRGRTFTITVKRQTGGRVSSWLHDHLDVGAVLPLDPPAGTFVLPNPLPARILLLSAGSGITPVMSMARTLARKNVPVDVAFLHVTRARAQTIFGDELDRLAAAWPGLTLHIHDSTRDGRFDQAALARLVPDWAERPTWLCGPAGFMAACRAMWTAHGAAAPLHVETFGLGAETRSDGVAAEIRCTRSERLFTAGATVPLLVAAEQAGLRPRYGCRMGICHTCSCVKRAGTVQNFLTGEISSEPGERIQLCISHAVSDLTIDL